MKNIVLPPRINPKKIGVIAPSSPVLGSFTEQQKKKGYEYIRQKGYEIEEGASMQLTDLHSDEALKVKLDDIHTMFRRDDIGCIMAFWGGFTANMLLDKIDYDLIKTHPKVFIGYSDITALTTAITTKTGLVTFSGPGVISFAKPNPFDYTWEYFEKACDSDCSEIQIEDAKEYADDLYFLRADNDHRIIKKNVGTQILCTGVSEGRVVAGNLQTLLVLHSTEYFPNLEDTILFLEEDETTTPALLERFLTQCVQLKIFEKVKGVVWGRMAEVNGFEDSALFQDILRKYFGDASYPVVFNADFGHTDPLFTIPHGGHVSLSVEGHVDIRFERAVQ